MTDPQAQPDAAATPERELLRGGLVGRNVRINGRRTSVRLEPEMWDALHEVAALVGCSIHDLCGAVEDQRDPAASFTGALRVFLMEYFRNAARASRPVSLIQKRAGESARRGGKSS